MIDLLAKYVTVVEYRLIISVNIVFQFQSSTFDGSLDSSHSPLQSPTDEWITEVDYQQAANAISYRATRTNNNLLTKLPKLMLTGCIAKL